MVSSPEAMIHAPPSTLTGRVPPEQVSPNSTCPKLVEVSQDSLLIQGCPFPTLTLSPPLHILAADAGADDEGNEDGDGSNHGDDHNLALVTSQVEDVHSLTASPCVALFAPAPWHRECPKSHRGAHAPLLPGGWAWHPQPRATMSPSVVAYTQAGVSSATRKRHLPLTQ